PRVAGRQKLPRNLLPDDLRQFVEACAMEYFHMGAEPGNQPPDARRAKTGDEAEGDLMYVRRPAGGRGLVGRGDLKETVIHSGNDLGSALHATPVGHQRDLGGAPGAERSVVLSETGIEAVVGHDAPPAPASQGQTELGERRFGEPEGDVLPGDILG